MLEPYTKGRLFRSQQELKHGFWLLSELQAGRVKTFEYEKSYDLRVEGRLICRIEPDFTVFLADGTVQAHEIKSPATMTPVWAVKRKLFEAVYPHIRYRVWESGFERNFKVIDYDKE